MIHGVRSTLLLLGLALFLGTACSLTTASGLDECEENSDCPDQKVCSEEGYCLPPPVGCEEKGGSEEATAYRLGAVFSLTPPQGTDLSERAAVDALTLAVEEVNQNGGVANRRFSLVICDSKGRFDSARAQARWLSESGVIALFTSGSDLTLTTAQEVMPRGTLVMSPTATSANLRDLADAKGERASLLWRTAPSDAQQTRLIAALLKGQVSATGFNASGITQTGLAYVNDVYGQGMVAGLLLPLNTAPLARDFQAAPYLASGDVSEAVQALATHAPQLTVLAGPPEDSLRVVEAAQNQVTLRASSGHRWFLTDASKEPGLFAQAAPAAVLEGSFGTAPAQGLPGDAGHSLFASSYQARFHRDVSQYAFLPHAYDAMYLVALATASAVGPDVLRPVPVTGKRLGEGLARLSPEGAEVVARYPLGPTRFVGARDEARTGRRIDVVGTSGELNFDPTTGEAPSRYEVWKVSQGRFEFVQQLEAP